MQAELLNSCLFLSISNRSKFILLKHCQFKLKVYYIRSTKKELQFSSWWLSIALLIAVAALTVTKSAANRWAAPMHFCLFVCLESTINSSYKMTHYLFINWQWRIIGPVVQENAEIMTWKCRSTNKLTFPWCSKILQSFFICLVEKIQIFITSLLYPAACRSTSALRLKATIAAKCTHFLIVYQAIRWSLSVWICVFQL